MRGVIFDFDGSLVDSLYIWESLAYDYLKNLGIDVNQEVYRDLEGMNLFESSAYIQKKYELDKTEKQINDELISIIEDYYINKFQLKDGAREFIIKLYDKGIKMCIGSVSKKELIVKALDRLGIAKYFEFIQTEENSRISKRCPKFFIEASRRLGLYIDEVVVVEDALYTIEAAKLAGFRVIGIWDNYNRHDRDKIEDLVDIYINDFNDLEVGYSGEIIDNSRI